MKHLTKTLITHLIILTSFLLCSCGASHSIRENVILKDDSFSYNHLINKDVVNSGVFSQLKDISYDDKIEASFLLSNILYEKLKD